MKLGLGTNFEKGFLKAARREGHFLRKVHHQSSFKVDFDFAWPGLPLRLPLEVKTVQRKYFNFHKFWHSEQGLFLKQFEGLLIVYYAGLDKIEILNSGDFMAEIEGASYLKIFSAIEAYWPVYWEKLRPSKEGPSKDVTKGSCLNRYWE